MWPRKGGGRERALSAPTYPAGERKRRERESAGGRKVLGEEREGKGRFGFVRKGGRYQQPSSLAKATAAVFLSSST